MIKKRLLTILCLCIVVILVIAAVFAVVLFKTQEADVLSPGVINLGTTTDSMGLLTNFAVSYLYDTGDGGLCSVAVTTSASGDTIVGRNLDMNLSNNPIYVGRTNITGFYQTVYASYIPDFGPDFDSCEANGVPGYIQKLVPFAAMDSLNSEGLYIQINMRMDQMDENGNNVFRCTSTNPDGEKRISAVELPSYVTLRCKNVEEAVALINDLDIYTLGGDIDWPFAYILADAEGNYGLIELGCNEVRWIPGQNIQTNFYISEDFNAIQKYKQGLGRYDYLEENLADARSCIDLQQIFENIKYSGIYDIDNPFYDIRSEMAGDEEYLTNEYLDNEDNWETFKQIYSEYVDVYNSLSDSEKRDAGEYWATAYTATVNCTQKIINFNFCEDYTSTYSFSADAMQTGEYANDQAIVIAAIEIFSLLISVVLLYGNSFEARRSHEKHTKKQYIYSVAIVFNMIGASADAIAWILDGNMNYPGLLKIVNGLALLMTYILISIFSLYLLAVLREKIDIDGFAFKLFSAATMVIIAVTTIMYACDMLLINVNGYYVSAPLYSLYSGVTAVLMITLVIMITCYAKILGPHDLIAIYIYFMVPLIAAVISGILPNLSFGYAASTLAFLAIYVMLQSETTIKLVDDRNVSSYRAYHDELTQLLSRRAYTEKLDFLEQDQTRSNVGVIFADINGLKYTNDKFGHAKGDELLVNFAQAARKVFREDDIHRISGDEFVILLIGINKKSMAEKIKQFEAVINEYKPPIASLGYGYGDCGKINELVSMAEAEMYKNKQALYAENPELKR